MVLPLLAWAAVAAVGGAIALVARNDDKKADVNFDEAQSVSSNALRRAKRKTRALNASYRPFFEEAVADYRRVYEALQSAYIKAHATPPDDIRDPGEIRFEDKLDVSVISRIDFGEIDWTKARQQMQGGLMAYRNTHGGMNMSPQALPGMAVAGGAAFAASALINYAERTQQRRTTSEHELGRAQTYAEGVDTYFRLLSPSIEEDIVSRKQCLRELIDGFDLAKLTSDRWPIAIGLLNSIVALVEQPISETAAAGSTV